MNVPERLAEVMKDNGITSANKLAKISGVSQTMISGILRGATSPSTATLQLLCEAMGLSLSDFYASSTKKEPAIMDGSGLTKRDLLRIKMFRAASPAIQAAAEAVLKSDQNVRRAVDADEST